MDFGLETDTFSSVETFYYNPKTAKAIEGPGIGRLSRMVDNTSQYKDCDFCEGYLQKKSPAIFIKWQVRYYNQIHCCVDQVFCA